MGVDKIDLVSKMEGFAVQGMRGAAKNHQERVSHLRGQIDEATGDPSAKMQWKYYFRNVVMRHKVMIKGWPSTIPFANLSDMSSSYSQLEMLLQKWESGAISWEVVSDEELETLREERNIQIEAGEIEDPLHRPRADKGTKRKRDGDNSRHRKKHRGADDFGSEDGSADGGQNKADRRSSLVTNDDSSNCSVFRSRNPYSGTPSGTFPRLPDSEPSEPLPECFPRLLDSEPPEPLPECSRALGTSEPLPEVRKHRKYYNLYSLKPYKVLSGSSRQYFVSAHLRHWLSIEELLLSLRLC
ncbi:hypothetical protein L210DRAFT_3648115 [Boletus edulis BED1]|uniref:Uncharacterized protein n=1 Tax=Boletus edulis BED1 TaxID=1328754 RepID=A0AAD4GCI1_BOLED|nr:hypothetical protein L210DRAFT_3648115 [Boletus edulis BED1]